MFNSEQMIPIPYSESHSFPVQYLIKTLVTLSVLDLGKNTFNTLVKIWQHIYGLLHSSNIAVLSFDITALYMKSSTLGNWIGSHMTL